MAKKTFVLRTNAILCCEGSTLQFGSDNEVVVPMAIFEQLHRYSGVIERKRIATHFLDYCSEFSAQDLSSTGAIQENGSRLFILDNKNQGFDDKVNRLSNLSLKDKRVLQVCLDLKKQGKDVYLISQNPIIRHKADLIGINAEPIKTSLFPPLHKQYSGILTIPVSSDVPSYFKKCGHRGMKASYIYNHSEYDWIENCFIQLKSPGGSIVIGRYSKGKIFPLQYSDKIPQTIKPENLEQQMLFEALIAPPTVAPLVIVKGGAGTGKTISALAVGLDRIINYGSVPLYNQILIAAPTIGIDDDIGFLPGDIGDKISPYLTGIHDNLKNIFRISNPDVDNRAITKMCNELFSKQFIDVQAIRFLRGRSIPNTYFIIDEAQNIPVDIILDILTRAGKGTKIILTGDPSQINRTGLTDSYNGLTFGSESMKGSQYCWQVTLNSDKIYVVNCLKRQ